MFVIYQVVFIHTHLYIYIERERKRERERTNKKERWNAIPYRNISMTNKKVSSCLIICWNFTDIKIHVARHKSDINEPLQLLNNFGGIHNMK